VATPPAGRHDARRRTAESRRTEALLQEVIHHSDQFYILATSSRIDDRTRVLKDGDTFAVFDRYGDIRNPVGLGERGLYHHDTRFLSWLEMSLGVDRPLLLSSTIREDNALLAVDLANPDSAADGMPVLAANSVHIFRTAFLWRGSCYQRFRVRNYAVEPVRFVLRIRVEADFADIFEVRGSPRERRGHLLPPVVGRQSVVLAYDGLDGVRRRTRIRCAPAPTRISASEMTFEALLEPRSEATFCLDISCEIGDAPAQALSYETAFAQAFEHSRRTRKRFVRIETSNEQFNDWLNRSVADLGMMITDTPLGPYPYAGVPWYNTVFGRDGIITALECLWIDPAIARGVLAHLADTQATTLDPVKDAEPGKIVHETRRCEMAATGEVPFGLYYGSIDSTPLFVMLAGAYLERTGDRDCVERLWPAIERALAWIRDYGDSDRDGFVEYARQGPKGLINQGWKDSKDSVFHADGALAEGPIALCEVQGYVYAAKRAAAKIGAALGKSDVSHRLAAEAEELRDRFERAFWCEELSTSALALAGATRPCRVRTSNAGHTLFTGIARPDRAARVARTLLADDSFSGWGIRTVSSLELRYNPMSYHNGSVWPHDNALIAAGLARYGFAEQAQPVLTALFDASLFLELHRLPELFCGFPRRSGEGPTLYPVACSPQAWAVGCAFLLLQVCLGLTIEDEGRRVQFYRPSLPESLQQIRIGDLETRSGAADLLVHRYPEDVAIHVRRRSGNLEIVSVR
jgi:glycogen debranching enzyme